MPKRKCAFEECAEAATELACGRRDFYPEPAFYCETHARIVDDAETPEYTTTCPNCSCTFGVN